ncbi:MAG: ParB family transcriptional regulator, chromosome partitioning protein [Verrucomicrobiota bacterium]|jgi:ParB-like chromosome segregation protein Spo0J
MEITYVSTDEIKFLFRRPRDEEVFAREVKSAIAEIGIRQPLKGIDISSWKPNDRRRPDGGLYRYLAGFGEGRTRAAQELYSETKDPRWKTVPFIVVNVPQGELLTWFLSENIQREDIPWVERAELLRADIDAGMTPQELAAKNHMTAGHVQKLYRVLKRTSPKVLDAVREMTVNEAETLSKQSHAHQEIIVEALKETGLSSSQTPHVVRLAQEEVAKTGKLSKAVLVGRIERLRQAVKDQRAVLKLKRVHLAIGPQIYGEELLKDRKLTKMLEERGINWKLFMEAYQK